MKKRTYRLGKRAESVEETRDRIVEATVALHEELGPKRTTISAIAEKAGVQRLTVYRHFPDEEQLFQACTSRWLELNQPPDPADWAAFKDGFERAEFALGRLYVYYRGTESMWTPVFRDEPEIVALKKPMQNFRAYLQAVRDDLVRALQPRGKVAERVSATLGLAVRFQTWQSLKEEGLSDARMAELVVAWLDCVYAGRHD